MRPRRRTHAALAFAIGLVGLANLAPASQPLDAAEVVPVVEGSKDVTGVAFTSDGRMVFAQRSGAVFIIQDGELRQEPIATITTSDEDGGVLALAAPPNAQDDPGVYALAAARNGGGSLVFRVALDLQTEPEIVVEGLPPAPGALAFRSDGTLLVAIADRILALTSPSDATGAGTATVLTTELEDAGGLAVDPVGGRVVATDASGAVVVDGPEQQLRLGFAPGLAAFGGPEAEAPYAGGLFVAERAGSEIHLVGLERRSEPDNVVVGAGGQVLALTWGPEGLYFSTEKEVSVVLLASDADPHPAVTPDPDEARGGPLAPRNRWFFVIVTLVFVLAYFFGRRRLLR